MTTTELCACGKPADHVNADPDTDEGTWACLTPNFDPATGVRLPPVGKYAPAVTPSAASGVTRADGEPTAADWAVAAGLFIDNRPEIVTPPTDVERAIVRQAANMLAAQRAEIHAQVLAIHRPVSENNYAATEHPDPQDVCAHCNWVYWPCKTVKALGIGAP